MELRVIVDSFVHGFSRVSECVGMNHARCAGYSPQLSFRCHRPGIEPADVSTTTKEFSATLSGEGRGALLVSQQRECVHGDGHTGHAFEWQDGFLYVELQVQLLHVAQWIAQH